jgi:hypothetical protein
MTSIRPSLYEKEEEYDNCATIKKMPKLQTIQPSIAGGPFQIA